MRRLLSLIIFCAVPAPAQQPVPQQPSAATKTAPVTTANAEHYLWGGTNDGWHLLKREDISIIQERMVPGSREERHLHHRARQFFYVLDGTLTMHMPDGDVRLPAGAGYEVQIGRAHV